MGGYASNRVWDMLNSRSLWFLQMKMYVSKWT